MTMIEALKKRLAPQHHPWADKYGTAILAMSNEEMLGWVEMVAMGHMGAAYHAVVARMDNADLLAEWKVVEDSWKIITEHNIAERQTQRKALAFLVNAILPVALAAFGG